MTNKTPAELAAEQRAREAAAHTKAAEYAQSDAPSSQAAEAFHRDQAAQAGTAAAAYEAVDKMTKKP